MYKKGTIILFALLLNGLFLTSFAAAQTHPVSQGQIRLALQGKRIKVIAGQGVKVKRPSLYNSLLGDRTLTYYSKQGRYLGQLNVLSKGIFQRGLLNQVFQSPKAGMLIWREEIADQRGNPAPRYDSVALTARGHFPFVKAVQSTKAPKRLTLMQGVKMMNRRLELTSK